LIGYLANLAFPRIGEVTRCASLNRSDKIPLDSLLGTVIAERAIDLVSLVVLLMTVFLIRVEFYGKFINDKIFTPMVDSLAEWINLSIWFWVLILVLAVAPFAIYYVLRDRIKTIKGVDKIKKILSGIISGLKTILIMKRRWTFIIVTLLLWGLYLITTWLLFLTLDATAGLTPVDALFVLVFATIGMTLPVQGGFGTYHLLVSLALTLYGIPREDGLLYAIISHESQILMFLILGSISMFIVFLSRSEKSELKTDNK
jgi:hypothetical protein